MSLVNGSVHLGDVMAQRTYVLGRVEPALRGMALKGFSICAEEKRRPNKDNYWVMKVGKMDPPNRFTTLKEILLDKGLPEGISLFTFNPPLVYDGGDYPAVRLRRFGGPGPLRGVVLVAEFDVEGDDERATK